MARRLELDVASKSDASGLVAQAKAVDHLRHEADRLEREFKDAERAAAGLDRELIKTKAATAALAAEFAKTSDKKIKADLNAQRAAARDLGRLRQDIVGDTERDAQRATRAWQKASEALQRDTAKAARAAERENNEVARQIERAARRAATAGGDNGLNFQALPINPQAAVAGVAAGAAAAPLVGGAVGGAVIGAGALAGVGLGVAGAVKGNKAVGDAWVVEATRVKDAWLEASKAFEGPTLAAAGEFRKAMESIDLDRIFGKSAKFVAPLAAGIGNALREIGDGFETLIDRADPVVAELGHGLSETGRAIKIFLEDISGEADGGAKALRDLFKIVNGFIVGTGRFIAGLEAAYDGLKTFQTGINDAYRAVADNSVGPIHAAAELGAAISGTGLEADAFGKAIEGAGVKTDDFGKVAGDAFYGLDQRARDATDTMARLNAEFEKAVNNALGLSNAYIAVEQDFDDLAESFKRGGDALDINTQKGRDNQQMINDTIADLERRRQAEIDAGGATAEAYAKANANYEAGKKRLEDFLVSMGIARDKAHALVEELAKVTDKKVTVEVKFIKTGDVSAAGVISTGDPRRNPRAAYATGTDFAKAGLAVVGEKGPELVNFRGGETVYNAMETSRMMASRSAGWAGTADGGGTRTLQPVVLQIGSYQIAKALIEYADTRGITVGRLLGIS